ncbi:MAG: hypothetical protein LBQ60_07615 [Bacteroidales bacterium]|jgi:hypothetical protein|nr:hypothetical protein [Bacteroidales bacterium]
MKRLIPLLILSLVLISYKLITDVRYVKNDHSVLIEWMDSLSGDFSFKDKWSYPEGIYVNKFGQLSCDGLCPDGIERMKDPDGRIFEDSLEVFYSILDTAHLYHTISCDAGCYEFAGTNFITVRKKGRKTVECYTHTNAATHCHLQMEIFRGRCMPVVVLNSISGKGEVRYTCNGGQIMVDKKMWDKGVMKADFHFTFDHEPYEETPVYWKGRIYAFIE